MLHTFQIFEDLSKVFGDSEAKVLTKSLTKIYDDIQNTVTKTEFNELKEVVADLAVAQKRTEERLEELAVAQKRTEERLDSLTIRVEELALAQKKTEERLDSLTIKVEELAVAQKRTEERLNALTIRVEELAVAQKRTEERLDALTIRVEELAIAQKKTEESLNKLIKRVDDIEDQLGGLAMAVGYGIEDKLFPYLENFAKKTFGVAPTLTVLRKNIIYSNGKYDEINLYTEAKKDGKDVLVIGECKSQPGKKDINKFISMLSRLESFSNKEVYPFIVGYNFNPEIEEYINRNYPTLKYYKTYEIEHGKF